MSLKDELTEIHGIGDAKAEEILDVVGEQGSDFNVEAFKEGMDYYENEDYEYAGKFFRQVL